MAAPHVTDSLITENARRAIDEIFDIELKKEALIKANRKYLVNVDAALINNLDYQLG